MFAARNGGGELGISHGKLSEKVLLLGRGNVRFCAINHKLSKVHSRNCIIE
jgi:hypothetical protein